MKDKNVTENINRNIVVAVIGLDMPGIVATISSVMTGFGCNLEEVSQITLHGQFTLIGVVNMASNHTNEEIEAALREEINRRHFKVSVLVRDFEDPAEAGNTGGEPYVASIWGKDRNDIITTFSRIFAEGKINIESLRAFPIENNQSLQVFEVSVPEGIDLRALQHVLSDRARSMGLRANIQHRDIFEAIHRVKVD